MKVLKISRRSIEPLDGAVKRELEAIHDKKLENGEYGYGSGGITIICPFDYITRYKVVVRYKKIRKACQSQN